MMLHYDLAAVPRLVFPDPDAWATLTVPIDESLYVALQSAASHREADLRRAMDRALRDAVSYVFEFMQAAALVKES